MMTAKPSHQARFRRPCNVDTKMVSVMTAKPSHQARFRRPCDVSTKMEGAMTAKPSHQVKFRRSCDVHTKMESVMKRQSQAHLAVRSSTADIKQPRQQLLLLPETISHKEQSGKAHHQHTKCDQITEFTGNTFLTADPGEESSPPLHSSPDI